MDDRRSKSNSIFNSFIADPKAGQRTMADTFTSGMFGTRIAENWEAAPMNTTQIYNLSPQKKWSETRGDFNAEKFLSRTFNRRMNQRDTFTKINPLYVHEPKTCKIPSITHIKHVENKLDDTGRPFVYQPRTNNHKFDEIKTYNEEMYKLGCFAPQPRKAANAPLK